jgi:RecB family exonuclease
MLHGTPFHFAPSTSHPALSFLLRMYSSISELLGRYPTQNKVLFTPQYQFGLTIEDTLARRHGGWAALTCMTPIQYANRVTKYRLPGQAIPTGAEGFLAAQAINELSPTEREALLLAGQADAQAGTARSLARLFDTLRREDISPEDYRQVAEAVEEPQEGTQASRRTAEANAFTLYDELLETHSYVDTAMTLKEATRAIEEGSWNVDGEVFAALGELTLTRLERRLLESLQTKAEAFFLIPSVPTATPATSGRAAYSKGTDGGVATDRGTTASQLTERAPGAEEGSSGSTVDKWRAYPKGTAGRVLDVPFLLDTAAQSGHTQASHTQSEPVSLDPGDAEGGLSVRCLAAVGAETEVRAVFRDILDRGLSLDDVEIAYTSADPYLALIDGLAEKWTLPVTLSVGRPVAETRPGQSLLKWLEWVREGLEAPLLIQLLRGGLLRIDRVQESKDDDPAQNDEANQEPNPRASEEHEANEGARRLSAARAATLLASIRYERGPSGRVRYRSAIDHQITRLQQKRRVLNEGDADDWRADSIGQEIADWRQLRHVIDELLALLPDTAVSAGEMAGRSRSFVIRFGPTDAPPKDTPKEDRTINQSARNRLVDQLSTLDNAAIPYKAPVGRLVGFLSRLIDGDKVRAARPLPGRVHVAPLESAGYAARPHLYVVGLDATSTGRLVQNTDLTVSDDERDRLVASTGATLVDLGGSPNLTAWKVEQVRARHNGAMMLCARTYDVREGEERHPSPLYLRWGGEEASDALKRPIGFATFSDDGLPLDDSAGWLKAYATMTRAGTGEVTGPEPASEKKPASGKEADKSTKIGFSDLYPGAARGLTAEQERTSEEYTPFDGLLPGGEYAELDVLDGKRVVSASRLERLANTPYLYFLQHVLNIKPLDEPALEKTGWLDPLRRGTILHDTFERFVRQLGGRAPASGDEAALQEVLEARFQEETDRIPAPSQFVEDMALRELWSDALIFLRAEIEAAHDGTPHAMEYGFGLSPDRHLGDEARGPAHIPFGNGKALQLRGQIDRVDRHPDGTFSIWDYKTGRSASFEGGDLLQDGQVLQWALYSYAFEALEKAEVREAGYFFTSAREMGRRITSGGKPARYRSAVVEALEQLSAMARTGTFPPNLDHYSWRYSGFEQCFPDRDERKKTVNGKEWPDDRPEPLHL